MSQKQNSRYFLRDCILTPKAALISDNLSDHEFSDKCEDCAVACYLKIVDQNDRCMATATANFPVFGRAVDGKITSASIQAHKKEDRPENKETTSPDEITKLPEIASGLIPITYEHNATRYSNAVCSWGSKILMALGVKPSGYDLTVLSSKDRKIFCEKALEHLLKQAEDCTAKYASEFEEIITKKLNSKFETLKLSLDNVLKNDE